MTIDESSSGWSADKLSGLWDLNGLRFRLADDCLTDFLRLDDRALLTDDPGILNDLLAVDDFRLVHNALFVDDARLHYDLGLVDQPRLANLFRLRHDMLIDHSALGANDLLLADDSRWLLNGDELWAAFLRRANGWALRHRVEVLVGVAFGSTLKAKEVEISRN